MKDLTTLRFILARGFDHLSAIAAALKKIDEEVEDETNVGKYKDKKERLSQLTMIFSSINDILHPSYPFIAEIFPEHELLDFVKNLDLSHKDTVKQNLFPPCQCSVCKAPNE